MKRLDPPPSARPDRYASTLLHDEENLRVVGFTLLPGQVVPPHSSASTVMVQVLAGSGRFEGASGSAELAAGAGAVYAPGETHAIYAGEDGVQFLALIAPRP